MELNVLEFLQGIFSLILVLIILVLSLIFFVKFFKHKRKDLLLVGIAWIGIAAPWGGDAINFVLVIFCNTILSEISYLIIVIAFLPIGIFCWLIAITDLMYKNMQKILLLIVGISFIIFEIFIFTLLFIDTALIGRYVGPFQVEYSLFVQVYFMILLVLFILPGIFLARESIRSEKPETRLKGKILLIAFIFAAIGASLDALFQLTAITVVIARLILMFVAIVFYIGWTLPAWVKNWFLKEN